MTYTLVNGEVLTDEMIEREADEFERGTWEGHLTDIRVGRPPLTHEKLVPVTVKFPQSMIEAIDIQEVSRSDYIRRALAAYLEHETLHA